MVDGNAGPITGDETVSSEVGFEIIFLQTTED